MSQHTYARARTIASEVGLTEEQAIELYARLHAHGIHLTEIDPEPKRHGEHAKPRPELLDETRARIAQAQAQAAAKAAEIEHTDQIRKQVQG